MILEAFYKYIALGSQLRKSLHLLVAPNLAAEDLPFVNEIFPIIDTHRESRITQEVHTSQ